jgi:predicted TIM-barrel fold metal-dependent hydrolase
MVETSIQTEPIISADSHVMEPHDLWTTTLPAGLRDQAPTYPPPKIGEGFQQHPGGQDPNERLKEMAADTVSAEILYPTLALDQFGLDSQEVQEASFRLYNDWLAEYCKVAPNRLVGVPLISMYDSDRAVKELERCHKLGLQGAEIWHAPHPDLPFYSDHYDRFFDAAQSLGAPISLHILTGFDYTKGGLRPPGVEHYRGSVNLKLHGAANSLLDFMFYGVLDKYPRLKIVLVEFEIGWMPFFFQQWSYYYHRFKDSNPPPMKKDPRDYLGSQVFATFFNDRVGGRLLGDEPDAFMWSNDFPHPNSTWPNSRQVIERDLGHLPAEKRAALLRDTVSGLYEVRI